MQSWQTGVRQRQAIQRQAIQDKGIVFLVKGGRAPVACEQDKPQRPAVVPKNDLRPSSAPPSLKPRQKEPVQDPEQITCERVPAVSEHRKIHVDIVLGHPGWVASNEKCHRSPDQPALSGSIRKSLEIEGGTHANNGALCEHHGALRVTKTRVGVPILKPKKEIVSSNITGAQQDAREQVYTDMSYALNSIPSVLNSNSNSFQTPSIRGRLRTNQTKARPMSAPISKVVLKQNGGKNAGIYSSHTRENGNGSPCPSLFSEEEDQYDIFNILDTNEDEVEDRAVEAFERAASVALHDTDRNGIAADKKACRVKKVVCRPSSSQGIEKVEDSAWNLVSRGTVESRQRPKSALDQLREIKRRNHGLSPELQKVLAEARTGRGFGYQPPLVAPHQAPQDSEISSSGRNGGVAGPCVYNWSPARPLGGERPRSKERNTTSRLQHTAAASPNATPAVAVSATLTASVADSAESAKNGTNGECNNLCHIRISGLEEELKLCKTKERNTARRLQYTTARISDLEEELQLYKTTLFGITTKYPTLTHDLDPELIEDLEQTHSYMTAYDTASDKLKAKEGGCHNDAATGVQDHIGLYVAAPGGRQVLPEASPPSPGKDVQHTRAPVRHFDAELAPVSPGVQAARRSLAIRAKTQSKGIHATIQAHLKLLFDTATDAFVYLDINATDTLTTTELQRGFTRLGLDANMRDLGAANASDDLIDLFEFLRLYAWHDIEDMEDLEEAVGVSRRNTAKIRAKALERLKALKAGGAVDR